MGTPLTARRPAGQSKNVGKMPTDSEDDSEEDSEDESSDDDAPMPEYLTAPKQPKKSVLAQGLPWACLQGGAVGS